MDDEVPRSIVFSCPEVGLGSTSKDDVNTFLRTLENGREHLARCATIFIKVCPGEEHNIPPAKHLTIRSFRSAAGITDACNQAYKSRRLLFDEVKENICLLDNNEDQHQTESNVCDEPGKLLTLMLH